MARCDQVVAKAHLSARLHMVLLLLDAAFHAHQASCLMARPLALSLVAAQLACFDRDAPLPTHQEEVEEEEQVGNNRINCHKCQFDLKISAYDNTHTTIINLPICTAMTCVAPLSLWH